jgi:hypothetical protein
MGYEIYMADERVQQRSLRRDLRSPVKKLHLKPSLVLGCSAVRLDAFVHSLK